MFSIDINANLLVPLVIESFALHQCDTSVRDLLQVCVIWLFPYIVSLILQSLFHSRFSSE